MRLKAIAKLCRVVGPRIHLFVRKVARRTQAYDRWNVKRSRTQAVFLTSAKHQWKNSLSLR